MNPYSMTDPKDKPAASDELMDQLVAFYNESTNYRKSGIEPRAIRNQKLVKGLPVEAESMVDKTSGRNKIYFRKIWSTGWRLVASFFQAFMMDKNKFHIYGRDNVKDYLKAQVLEFVTRIRFERMLRRDSAFVKIIWAFFECFSPGITVVKQFWKYNEDLGIDEPGFTVYPLEQVCLDWAAATRDEMRYVALDNYLTMEDMKDLDYSIPDEIQAVNIPQSALRNLRYNDIQDPLKGGTTDGQNYSNGTVGRNFPDSGGIEVGINPVLARYHCVELYWKRDNKIYMATINPGTKKWLKKPECSPYGSYYPLCIGSMLLDPHRLVPEGMPEALEGPQESLNFGLNLRKANQRMAMNGGFIYSRFGNVDKQALRNLHPGFMVAADDPSAVREIKMPDVTQSAYQEAGIDQAMIEELSSINDTILGQSSTGKTGEAQINASLATAKLDLFTAVVGQTFFQQFIYNLAYHCALFETDEELIRMANNTIRDRKNPGTPDDFKDEFDLTFDFDVEVDVGMSEVSRAVQAQKQSAFFDRALQSNNAMFQMMQAGIQIEEPKIFNLGDMMADMAEQFGVPNAAKYLVPAAPPPPEAPSATGGPQGQVAAGQNAPQPNEAKAPSEDFMKMMNSMMKQGGMR